MNHKIEIVDHIEVAFAETMGGLLSVQLETKETALLALSGGPTATRCYEQFFNQTNKDINFKRVHIIIGDERCVSVSDSDSNFGMIKTILDKNSVTPATLTPLSCATLGRETIDILNQFRNIDIIHLGLGSDGHTASLFPDSPALNTPKSTLVALNEDIHGVNLHKRITLTFHPINCASFRIITVSGTEKADILKQALDGDPLPVNQLNKDNLIWLADNDAASKLD